MPIFLAIFFLAAAGAGILLGFDFFLRGGLLVFFDSPFYLGAGFFFLILVCLLVILLIFNLFQRRWNNFLRTNYLFWAIYFGFVTILFFEFPLFYFANAFFTLPRFALEVIVPVSAFLLTIFAAWEGQRIAVKKIQISTNGISRDFKIAHISDLHLGPIFGHEFLADVVARTNALAPDFVVLTGDLFDTADGANHAVLAPLRDLRAPIYFVFGNHDIRLKSPDFDEIFARSPLRILRDEHTHFADEIEIVGLDGFEFDRSASHDYLANLHVKDKFRLLLSHAPINFAKSRAAEIDLQLAGHLHGGQIFPFNLVIKLFFFPFVSGFYEKHNVKVHISPGTGTWGPPLRLGSQNEITIIHLQKKAE
ncbi:MAG: metallophosphoesterase [Patescibacteria group bacterium]